MRPKMRWASGSQGSSARRISRSADEPRPRVALVCPLTHEVFARKIIVLRQLSFPNLGKGRDGLSPSGDPHRADHDAERETRSVVLLRHHDLSRQRDTRLDAGDDDRLAWG